MTLVHLVIVEMRRALHRRVVWWMSALALAGCVVLGIVALATVGETDPLVADHPGFMRSWPLSSDGDSLLGVGAGFLAIGAAVCGASVGGAEWKAGTVTTLLTWVPARGRLHAARTIAAAICAFVIGFVLQVAMLVAALPAVVTGGSTDGTDRDWWAAVLLGLVRISLVASMLAVLALNVATVGRNTTPALVALAAWALIGEGIIRGLRPGLARFLIGENVATVVPWRAMENQEFHRPPTLALVTLVVYLAIVVGVATVSFTRRDVAGAS